MPPAKNRYESEGEEGEGAVSAESKVDVATYTGDRVMSRVAILLLAVSGLDTDASPRARFFTLDTVFPALRSSGTSGTGSAIYTSAVMNLIKGAKEKDA